MCFNRKQHSCASGTSWAPGSSAPEEYLAVEYRGRLQIAVSGTFTGNLYRFSPLQSVQQVDSRDAFYLLDSGLFGISQ